VSAQDYGFDDGLLACTIAASVFFVALQVSAVFARRSLRQKASAYYDYKGGGRTQPLQVGHFLGFGNSPAVPRAYMGRDGRWVNAIEMTVTR